MKKKSRECASDCQRDTTRRRCGARLQWFPKDLRERGGDASWFADFYAVLSELEKAGLLSMPYTPISETKRLFFLPYFYLSPSSIYS